MLFKKCKKNSCPIAGIFLFILTFTILSYFLCINIRVYADEMINVTIPVEMVKSGGFAVLSDNNGDIVQEKNIKDNNKDYFTLSLPYGDYTYTVKMRNSNNKIIDKSEYKAHIVTYLSDSGINTYTLIITNGNSNKKKDSCKFININNNNNNKIKEIESKGNESKNKPAKITKIKQSKKVTNTGDKITQLAEAVKTGDGTIISFMIFLFIISGSILIFVVVYKHKTLKGEV